MMKMNAWLTASLLLSSSAFAATAPHWEYSGESGPDNWAKLTPEFAACAGKNQSPVNIGGTIKAALAPIKTHYVAGGNELVNNGHTLQVNYQPGSTLELDGQRFTLKQFHFHVPSENLIRGQAYPLEAHLVHANDKGELAVLAVMFKVGAANKLLDQAWKSLPKSGNKVAFDSPLDARKLLPTKLNYYRFSGSLTTPPCSEGVRWLVLKHPMTVSQAQLDAFKTAIPHANNRPVQSVNAREILE